MSTTEYAYQTGSTVSETPVQTNTYSYTDSNWKDKLTSYNGNNITYDAIGNPTAYYNGFSFTWEKGRQLASATNGTDTVTYVYDHDGRRVGKTVNGVTSSYTLEGDKVLFERNGDTNLWYYYDAKGSPVAIKVRNVIHLYRKNLQGDVTGIYSGLTGELLVSYVYDAWGKVTATDEADTDESAELIELNPYLYRGYRYDQETGLYYLQSRYYDPETGRFINADVYASTGDSSIACNMFAYCSNNPVNAVDPSGDIAITTIILIASIIVGVAVAAYTACEMQSSGADVRDIIFYSLGNGILAFGTVYSVGTSAYGLYYTMCSIHGYTPVTQIGPTKGVDIGPVTSTSAAPATSVDVAEQLQRCADDANKAISGTGHVAGSLKHTAFKNAVDALNNPNIRTEISYLGKQIKDYGTKGSVRFDVVIYNSSNIPICAYDFKTGSAVLTPNRIAQMLSVSGLDIPIYMIK